MQLVNLPLGPEVLRVPIAQMGPGTSDPQLWGGSC